ncbi:hypothetical protein FHP26_00690 [Pseudomonas orientalis]|nr:hypothetical protein [Pseudomonas orientalis]
MAAAGSQSSSACPDAGLICNQKVRASPDVGASLLAKNSQAPRSFRRYALSLRFFASKLAPAEGGDRQALCDHLAQW